MKKFIRVVTVLIILIGLLVGGLYIGLQPRERLSDKDAIKNRY